MLRTGERLRATTSYGISCTPRMGELLPTANRPLRGPVTHHTSIKILKIFLPVQLDFEFALIHQLSLRPQSHPNIATSTHTALTTTSKGSATTIQDASEFFSSHPDKAIHQSSKASHFANYKTTVGKTTNSPH
ncbi:hypothetical protein EKO04_008814 [Ascochyta lentis]|uniref:Uncharacterized protein n=1 Tax=Ascochyta lentis TaxID=205686 RepID=A0A8H7MEF7_9PLEO|nr:hypothetical protein EKO04_008814 [Ascochyta lentis]